MCVYYITICHLVYANIDIYATNAKYLFQKKRLLTLRSKCEESYSSADSSLRMV